MPGFCQSDLLARFAMREFTNIESGFKRLTRICNWIYDMPYWLSRRAEYWMTDS
jgi:hypothetical protein